MSYNVSKERLLGNMEFTSPLLACLFFQTLLKEKAVWIRVFGKINSKCLVQEFCSDPIVRQFGHIWNEKPLRAIKRHCVKLWKCLNPKSERTGWGTLVMHVCVHWVFNWDSEKQGRNFFSVDFVLCQAPLEHGVCSPNPSC